MNDTKDDLIARLQRRTKVLLNGEIVPDRTCAEAADRIASLTEQVKELRAIVAMLHAEIEGDAEINEAAVSSLRAENEKMREALKPFAAAADDYDPDEGDDNDPAWNETFTIGALRRARNSLRRQQ